MLKFIMTLMILVVLSACQNAFSPYASPALEVAVVDNRPNASSNMSGIDMKTDLFDCGYFTYEANGFKGPTAWGYLIDDSFDIADNSFKEGPGGIYEAGMAQLSSAVTVDILCTDASGKVIAFKTLGDQSRAHLSIAQKIRVINEVLCQGNSITLAQLTSFSNGVPLPSLPVGWLNGTPEDQCD